MAFPGKESMLVRGQGVLDHFSDDQSEFMELSCEGWSWLGSFAGVRQHRWVSSEAEKDVEFNPRVALLWVALCRSETHLPEEVLNVMGRWVLSCDAIE